MTGFTGQLQARDRVPNATEPNVLDVPLYSWKQLHKASQEAAANATAVERERRLAFIAQLRGLHQPFGIYTECGHDHTEDDAIAERAIDCGDFLSCADGLMYQVCAHCCRTDDGDAYQLEVCADTHDHGPGKPICQTIALVDQLESAGAVAH